MKSGSFRVREGNRVVTVSRHAKGWRFGYLTAGGWRYVTRRKRVEIEEAARQVLEEMGTGFVWSALPVGHRAWLEKIAGFTADESIRRLVDDFLEARMRSVVIDVASARWLEAKRARAGEDTPHLRNLANQVAEFSAAFPGRRLAEVDFDALKGWLDQRTAGKSATTYGHWRSMLVEFWAWAKREGIVTASQATPAERLPSKARERQEKRVASRVELEALLGAVGPEWRAWVVLGAWCGLRPEEICPGDAKKRHKRGLRCEDIDWEFGVIRVAADVSKVGRARIVPLFPAAAAGLRWAGIEPGMTGAVVLRSPARKHASEAETTRLGRAVFGGRWPKDVLRHSFGSYRNAALRNLDQVAEEMGTSVAMLHRHYHNPRAEAEGLEWFRIPEIFEVSKSSDGMAVFPVSENANRKRKPLKAQ